MTSTPPPTVRTGLPSAPALIVPASGVGVRLLSDTHAELTLTNPMVHCSIPLDAEQAHVIAEALTAAADGLTLPGQSLVVPPSGGAGRIVVPSGGDL